jgi:hypothetical protein
MKLNEVEIGGLKPWAGAPDEAECVAAQGEVWGNGAIVKAVGFDHKEKKFTLAQMGCRVFSGQSELEAYLVKMESNPENAEFVAEAREYLKAVQA